MIETKTLTIKLHKSISGKKGEYPADTWLPAKEVDGFIFVSYPEKHQFMKIVAKSNIKEQKDETGDSR